METLIAEMNQMNRTVIFIHVQLGGVNVQIMCALTAH